MSPTHSLVILKFLRAPYLSSILRSICSFLIQFNIYKYWFPSHWFFSIISFHFYMTKLMPLSSLLWVFIYQMFTVILHCQPKLVSNWATWCGFCYIWSLICCIFYWSFLVSITVQLLDKRWKCWHFFVSWSIRSHGYFTYVYNRK